MKLSIRKIKPEPKKDTLNNINQVPGKIVYVGEKEHLHTRFDVINYDLNHYDRHQIEKVEEVLNYKAADKTTWININGLNNSETIAKLGQFYGLHPLLLEDVVNTKQRPKFDEYDEYLFVVVKMFYPQGDAYVSEHLSLVVGENYLLSFQESENDIFENLRQRMDMNGGYVRQRKSDYLMYALLDVVMDNYFVIMEDLGRRIEDLEDSILLGNADDEIVQDIQNLKREIIQMRRDIYPLRDMTSRLENSENSLIFSKTYNYLRDLHDHSVQVSDTIAVYREMIWGLMDLYISTINNKMNEVMKVLTIMASIFIPLTFIAGVYGMNFDVMPELHWQYGYYTVWGIMIAIIVVMLIYFKRKGWL